MRIKLLLSALALGLFTPSFSQNEIDALRYSWIGTGGSARYQSLAGAMGAVGGDISCVVSNPAGLARFTKSDVVFTLAHTGESTSVLYNENTAFNGKGGMGINNIGLVAAFKNDEENEWKSIQFSIGYNKLSNFNNAIRITGVSPNSILDQFAADASGIPSTDLYEALPYTSFLAYEAYLIDPDLSSSNNEYTTQVYNSPVLQDRSIDKRGNYGETNISISGNYLDKIYLGGSIGFPSLKYFEKYVHNEVPLDTSLQLESFDYSQDLTTKGNGVNLKLGVIYTPTTWLRLGLAAHTPSIMSLTDRWSNTMYSIFTGVEPFNIPSDNGLFSYRLKTPGRIIGSAAFIISKWGLISMDYEYVNYGTTKFKRDNYYGSEGYNFSTENLTIKTIYNNVSNIRIGGEARYNWITLRGGYAIYGNPFKDGTTTVDATRTSYTGGIGVRVKGFYADLGYVITKWDEAYFMYDPLLVNTAKIQTIQKQFSITAGFRF